MPLESAKVEVSQVLVEALNSLDDNGVAVWSNESIYEKPLLYVHALQEAQSKLGINVVVVAYVRAIKSYVASAYKQWGVRHKTYSGSVVGFAEWVGRQTKFLSYGAALKIWEDAFTSNFKLFNYDVLDDVRISFMQLIPGCEDMLPPALQAKDNASPGDLHLALYALYNSLFAESVLPIDVASLISRNKLAHGGMLEGSLAKLYPSGQELDDAIALFTKDQEIANQILSSKQQPLLQNSLASSQPSVASSADDATLNNGVLSLLIAIAVEQEKRIVSLETLVATLVKKRV
ncbi:MAG TPA: hypothetical protein DDY43_08775 [Synechococcales bacterium UBA10510]|nr:hypothetical protein [Synechococcales bacterium UBA10510]